MTPHSPTADPRPVARTFEHDDALPRVPLPDLEDSCERFLAWCAPLLDEEQLAATRAAVGDDLREGSVLRRMQDALVAYDREPGARSWLEEFWRDRYLGRRDRIALNANFFFLLADTGQDQLTRATHLVDGLLAHRALVDAEELPPLERRGQPLSMDQNRFLYSSTRIPGEARDTSRTVSSTRHVVVLHRGRMARLDVLDAHGGCLPLDVLRTALERTRDRLAEEDWPRSAGALTSLPRAEWAGLRDHVLSIHPGNADALRTIEDALFCLVLDDTRPGSLREAGDLLLAGDAHDRWFDKSLTFVVLGDGRAGINGEHGELDGTTIASLVDHLAEHEPEPAPPRPGVAVPEAEPVRLVLDDETWAAVDRAAADFADVASATTSATLLLDDLGSDAFKAAGVSPDAFVQAALQAARHRLTGDVGATYESIATRHWQAGRTEAMRVVTPHMVAFARAMADPATTPQERRTALDAAAQAHVERARECQQGDAPEQHLWELQLLARRGGEPEEPALHGSPGWRVMRDDRLSTSAVPSPNIQLFGFGSTAPACVGVAYVLLPGRLHLYLSAPDDLADLVRDLAAEVERVLREMLALPGGEA